MEKKDDPTRRRSSADNLYRTPEAKSATQTPETESALSTSDPKSSLRSPDPKSSLKSPDRKSSRRSPDPDPKSSRRSPDRKSSLRSPDPDPKSSLRSPDPDPKSSLRSPDRKSSPRSPDPKSVLGSPDPKSDQKTPDKKGGVMTPDRRSAVRTPGGKSPPRTQEAKNIARTSKPTAVIRSPKANTVGKTPNMKPPDDKAKPGSKLPSPPSDSQTITSSRTTSTVTSKSSQSVVSGLTSKSILRHSPVHDRRDDLRHIFGERLDPESTTIRTAEKSRGISKATVLFIVVVVVAVGIIAYFVMNGKKSNQGHGATLGSPPPRQPFECPTRTTSLDHLAVKTTTDVSSKSDVHRDLQIEWTVTLRLPQQITEKANIRTSFVSMIFPSTRYKTMVLFTMEHCASKSQQIFLFPEASSNVTVDRLNLKTWLNGSSKVLQNFNCTSTEFTVPGTGKAQLVSTVTVVAMIDFSKPLLQVSICNGQICRVIHETTTPDLIEDNPNFSSIELIMHEGWIGMANIGKDYQMLNYTTVEAECSLQH